MTPLSVIDRIGHWLVHELSAQNQLRLGVILVFISLPLYPYVIWANEPPLVYLMSAAALTLTGVGIVLGAELLVSNEDDDPTSPCSNCGHVTDEPE